MPLALLSSPHFLRHVLRLDALSCAVCGLLQVLVPGQMSTLLALPVALLTYSGAFLLLYAALVAWIASRVPLPRTLVWLLLVGNLAWALGCVLLLVGTGLSSSTLGTAYVLLQALTVLVLAELQFVGLRRAAPAEPAW